MGAKRPWQVHIMVRGARPRSRYISSFATEEAAERKKADLEEIGYKNVTVMKR